MDPFTQRLMDRARARRENLEKKLSEQTAPRKRPMPLGDHNEIVTDTSSTCSQDDDSPKRQCVRATEQQIKNDTPAIASVKARRAVLSSGDMEVDDYVPPLRPRHDVMVESENTAPAPVAAGRRNRFAALANNINNWEDDLSHPRPKQVEKPKKGWQPPKKPVEPEPTAPPRRQNNRSSQVIPDGPAKPTRTFEHEASSSAIVQRSEQKKTVVSSITVNLGSPKPSTIQIVPGTTTAVSPSVQGTTIDIVHGTTTAVSPSVKKIGSSSNLNSSPRPFRKHGADSPLTKSSAPTTTRSPLRSVAAPAARSNTDTPRDEPTSRPVSSRMAAWQDKASPAKNEDNEPTKQPVATRKGLWEQKINEAEKEKKPVSPIKPGTRPAPKASRPQSTVVMREKSTRRSRDPTDETVHNRMSLWEKRVIDSNKETSPTKPPRPASVAFGGSAPHRAADIKGRRPSPVKSVVSSVKSPEKVGHATKTLADRLNEMQSGWQKNEIAEKIREQKEKEMAMLQNRWKNGLPCDDPQPQTDAPEPPPPPPLPPVAQQRTSPKKATPQSGKREVARQKIRTDEKEDKRDINDPSHPKNFEGKLRAMGFDVHSGDEVGKVAVADLTPIKQKEKQQQAKAVQSPKVSSMQLKVVNVEDTRTTVTTFGDTKVSVKQTEGTSVSSSSKPQGGKTSIYQLIKNKGVATPTRAPPTAKLTYDDSFESESSFAEEDEEGYSLDEYPEEPKLRETASNRAGASKMQAATSQNSVYSETSEYSEYTETEDGGDRTEEYTEDDDEEDYSEEEESEDGEEGGVDDLLDEVMDDTVNTETDTTETESDVPVPAPRQSIPKTHTSQPRDHRGGSGSSTSQQEDFRVPAVQPPRRRDNRVTFRHDVHGGATSSSSQYTASSTSSGGSSSASESEDERAYTIDLYRKSRPHSTIPSMTIVRQSEQSQRMSVREEPLPFIPEKSVRQQLRDLQDTVNQEQSVIQQTSNALNQCCGANSNFANSIEAVECHRLLLISCKKREGYLAEMERLRSSQPSTPAGPRGSLTVSDIRLPLKKDFVQKIGSLADTAQHFFLCLLRNGANTIISQMVSTHDAMVRDTLDIPNLFKLSDIAQDFHFNLEIYSMSISREQNVTTPKKKAKAQTPKKGLFGTLKPSTPRSMQSPGGPNVVRTTNFSQIANLPISIRSINKTHFTLDRVPYASPLQGTIHVRLQCLMESAVEEKGFLTMFEDVGGFGAWHRRWCVLRNNVLSYWKYPDDENIKEAIGYIDLKACITDKVGLIPRDICARPNTFELVTVRRQHRGDSNTLVTRCANTMTTTRHQLSADTKEDRVVWCDSLNKALATLRAWNSDAMRPIKVVKPDYADAITECIKSVNRKARP